ncbi:MAG: arsenite methyltransferase [Chloroflexi bacterium]|nr:arsenite methyltransferase [Chloroflexota bacterium]
MSSSDRHPSEPAAQDTALRTLEALSHPVRLRILDLLGQREACFCGDMVEVFGMAQSTVSHHLKVLKEAGLIRGTSQGIWVCYCLDPEGLERARLAVDRRLRRATDYTQEEMKVSEQHEAIKEAVRGYYGQKARSQIGRLTSASPLLPVLESAACCSAEETTAPAGATDALPEDISQFSLGCGNPVGIASIQPGEAVLDLGSGGGLDCFLAAQRTGPQGRVIGVDMNPDMVALARKNTARVQAQNVEFRLGELEHLPVESETVDLVISNCVINLVPDKNAVFREAFRALRPGGRLCVADIVASAPLPASLRDDPQQWCGCVAGAIPQEEYLERLRAAGFQDLQVLQSAPTGQALADGVCLLSATIAAVKP